MTAMFSGSSPGGVAGSWESDEDADMDDEDAVVTALGCLGPLGGLLAPELQRYHRHIKDQRGEQGNIGELSPGAVGGGGGGGVRGGGGGGGARAEHQAAINSMMMERMSTDIYALKKQYTRIKRRQQQQAMQLYIRTDKCPATRVLPSQLNPSSSVINHLLLGRRPRADPPPGGANPTSTSTATLPGSRPAPLPPGQEAGLVSPGPSCSSSSTPPSTPSANGFSPLASSSFYKTSCPSTPSLSSACSSSRLSSSPSAPVFSPFPSVKQPRRSAAARNLGLYGPTARTPSVLFPQISRSLNRSSAAGATGSPT
ncbi:TBC1 domain family member 30 [Liparis tanakae]|uniref:TBC1 domain family member 30 n=1 Tax=Liparis tanakae TaxID=230148 RepID=A0A4Z2GCL2_9TELE|nr:TBC1 domain family member 30 [Liparis tanakae]